MGGAQVWSKMDCCTLTLWFTGVFAVLLIYSFFLSMRKKYSLNGKHVLVSLKLVIVYCLSGRDEGHENKNATNDVNAS